MLTLPPMKNVLVDYQHKSLTFFALSSTGRLRSIRGNASGSSESDFFFCENILKEYGNNLRQIIFLFQFSIYNVRLLLNHKSIISSYMNNTDLIILCNIYRIQWFWLHICNICK